MRRVVLFLVLTFVTSGPLWAMGFFGGGGGQGNSNATLSQTLDWTDQVVITEVLNRNYEGYLDLQFWLKNNLDRYIWAFAVGLPQQNENAIVFSYPNTFDDGVAMGLDHWQSKILVLGEDSESTLRASLSRILSYVNLELSDDLWDSIFSLFEGYPYAFLTYFPLNVDENGKLLPPYYVISPGDVLEDSNFGIVYYADLVDFGSPFLLLTSQEDPSQSDTLSFSFIAGETQELPKSPESVVPEPSSLGLVILGLGAIFSRSRRRIV